MNRFILKNIFINIHILLFDKYFIETRSQSCVLKTELLSKTTFLTSPERVHCSSGVADAKGGDNPPQLQVSWPVAASALFYFWLCLFGEK
jgi:hypothetical protein